jgi:hypothetical protein
LSFLRAGNQAMHVDIDCRFEKADTAAVIVLNRRMT